jgi:predicted nucleic acid-binding protein
MIAADTSSLVAFFSGQSGEDVSDVAAAMSAGDLVLPPVVVTEMLSDPDASDPLAMDLPALASIPVDDGYWARAGRSRQKLQRHRMKAKIADALIAQFCIDNSLALITRDRDFRHFAKHCGLRLATSGRALSGGGSPL